MNTILTAAGLPLGHGPRHFPLYDAFVVSALRCGCCENGDGPLAIDGCAKHVGRGVVVCLVNRTTEPTLLVQCHLCFKALAAFPLFTMEEWGDSDEPPASDQPPSSESPS